MFCFVGIVRYREQNARLKKENKMKEGYYWIRMKNNKKWIIGYYWDIHADYPWIIIGSDEIFKPEDIEEIGEKIEFRS